MKKLGFALSLLLAACGADPVLAADSLKIDPSVKDADGIPMCPAVVTQTTAFSIFGPAMKQAKSWHAPTQPEIAQTKAMIKAFKDHDYPQMLKSADAVGLQTCRVIEGDDKYILFLTKYGKSNYNGTFFILRDAEKVSKITVIAPHVLTDNYHNNAPAGVQRTHARALIQNGYHKGLGGGRLSDFSHTKDNLGFWAVKALNENFPRQLVLHIHGMKNPNAVLRRPTDSQVIKAFDKAIREHTNITNFQPFNAFYEIDPPNSTAPGLYVKTEIPVRIYMNNINIVASIVTEFEKLPIAWDSPESLIEPEESAVVAEDDAPHVAPFDDDDFDPADMVAEESEAAKSFASWVPPKPRNLLGTRSLTCVATKYLNKVGIGAPGCQAYAKTIADFYTKVSRGKFKLTPKVVEMSFDFDAPWKDTSKVENAIRTQYKSDYYMLPLLYKKGGNHASGHIAKLTQQTGWVGEHEVGHLLGLPHGGAFNGKDVSPERPYGGYEHYGDNGYTVMADAVGSHFLTAPEMYHMGWLEADEIKVFDESQKEYVMGRANDYFKGPGLAVLIIPPKAAGKVPMISPLPNCPNCVAYHLTQGGLSMRVKIIKDEWTDPVSGLHIKVLGDSPAGRKIEVNYVVK
jgi:hypothetical protein